MSTQRSWRPSSEQSSSFPLSQYPCSWRGRLGQTSCVSGHQIAVAADLPFLYVWNHCLIDLQNVAFDIFILNVGE